MMHYHPITAELLVVSTQYYSVITYMSEDVRCFIKVNECKVELIINKCCSIMPRTCSYFKLFLGLPSITNKHVHVLLTSQIAISHYAK